MMARRRSDLNENKIELCQVLKLRIRGTAECKQTEDSSSLLYSHCRPITFHTLPSFRAGQIERIDRPLPLGLIRYHSSPFERSDKDRYCYLCRTESLYIFLRRFNF